MPGLSNRNPVAGYGNIGQVHIRYKPKPPPRAKYGVFIFLCCVLLFLFAYCWTDPWRRYTLALGPLRIMIISLDKLRHMIYDNSSRRYDNFEVIYDNFGHPLVEGKTISDVIFGQGYTHAQHHLFQMDYLRQKAYGNLSQYEGNIRLSSDLLVRAVGLSELAQNDLKNQNEEEMSILRSYSDGVNAYLSEKHVLPLEYTALGVNDVEKWKPVDTLCILRYFALQFSDSWETTLTRRILAQSMKKDSNSWVELDDIDSVESTATPFSASAGMSWVLSGDHSPSGKPLLFTRVDHESSSIPAYVQNTLKTTSNNFHVAGVSIPGTPLVLMGRNSRIAWTVSPISTPQHSKFLGVETIKKDSNCDAPQCAWYSRSEDGSWVAAEMKIHNIGIRHWNKLSTDSNISQSTLVTYTTDNGILLTYDLFQGSSWLSSKGPAEGDISEYLVGRFPATDPEKAFRISALIRLNSASHWDDFTEALASPKFPFDWQFLFASGDGDIARIVPGQSPQDIKNPASGIISVSPELSPLDIWSPSLKKFTEMTSPSCTSSRRYSSFLQKKVMERVNRLELSKEEILEISTLLKSLEEGNTRSARLIDEIQASFIGELSLYLRATSFLLGNSISPLRTLSSSVHIGSSQVPSLIDELIALSDQSESVPQPPHLRLLSPSQLQELLFSLGGSPRLQVRIDRAIVNGYRRFIEYGTQHTRYPHPLQTIEYSGEVFSLGPLDLPRDGSRCDLERWSNYRGSCLSTVHRALYDLSSPSNSFLGTFPGASSQISSQFYASTLLLSQSCGDATQRLLWDAPASGDLKGTMTTEL